MIDESILEDIRDDDVSAISVSYPVTQAICRELLLLRKLAEDMAEGIEEDVFEGALESVASYRNVYPKEGA